MIDRFAGPHAFLSNFSPSPVVMYGVTYPTVEHAFAAAKTLNAEERKIIARAGSPGEAKKLGRRVKLRPDWDSFRLVAMEQLLARKFAPGTQLAYRLTQTAPHELVERNTWNDRFWGVCNDEGANHLGRLLMERREVLKSL